MLARTAHPILATILMLALAGCGKERSGAGQDAVEQAAAAFAERQLDHHRANDIVAAPAPPVFGEAGRQRQVVLDAHALHDLSLHAIKHPVLIHERMPLAVFFQEFRSLRQAGYGGLLVAHGRVKYEIQ